MTPRILIATPIHTGMVHVEYMFSVTTLMGEFNRDGVFYGFITRAGTDIARQRNWMASFFLHNRDFTHILFVDDDMVFAPSAVFKLMRSGHHVCGCAYPKRTMSNKAFFEASRRTDGEDRARNISQSYVAMGEKERARIKRDEAWENGFVSASAIGLGLTLISRQAFEIVNASHPDLAQDFGDDNYADLPDRRVVTRCFDHITTPEGRLLSEDLSFCYRWRLGCAQKIWVCLDEEIGHVGRHVFRGRAMDYIADDG